MEARDYSGQNGKDLLFSPFTPFIQMGLFLVLLFAGVLVGSLVSVGVGMLLMGGSLDFMAGLSEDSPKSVIDSIRIVLAVSHLFSFWLPAIVFGALAFKSQKWKGLFVDKPINLKNIGWVLLIMLFAYPVVQIVYQLNQAIPFPDVIIAMEKEAEGLTKAILNMDTPLELLVNLVVIAVIPAVGEELVFRGGIQGILQRIFKNHHLAIWIAAFLFSFFHFQFQGFLPRMALGGILGYLLHWTGSLWAPILGHFLFNGLQVVGQFVLTRTMPEVNIEEVENIPPLMAVISIIGFAALSWFMMKDNVGNELKPHSHIPGEESMEELDILDDPQNQL